MPFDGSEKDWKGSYPSPRRPGSGFDVNGFFAVAGVVVCGMAVNSEMEVLVMAIESLSGPYGLMGAARILIFETGLLGVIFDGGMYLATLSKIDSVGPKPDLS